MPAFMPVGTQGTVKGVDPDRLRGTGAQMILANTYHLALRPGEETVAALGGLHAFMGWDGPILTDSGGFQVFSLADRMQVTEQGVEFRSHIDGAAARADARAVDRDPGRSSAATSSWSSTTSWRCPTRRKSSPTPRGAASAGPSAAARRRTRSDQMLFAIVQGGLDPALRRESAAALAALDFPGYAVGGLSVGEPPAEMYAALDAVDARHARRQAALPDGRRPAARPARSRRPRHRPVRLRHADPQRPQRAGVHRRAARCGCATQSHQRDREPLEADCPCPACRHSRGYLRHLFQAGEMLGPILASIHNLTYYQRLLAEAREAIAADAFAEFREARLRGWASPEAVPVEPDYSHSD